MKIWESIKSKINGFGTGHLSILMFLFGIMTTILVIYSFNTDLIKIGNLGIALAILFVAYWLILYSFNGRLFDTEAAISSNSIAIGIILAGCILAVSNVIGKILGL